MKPLTFSPTFIKKLKLIKQRNQTLSQKIKKQLESFQASPKHPSLRLHKLSGNLHQVWSISVTKSFRLIYQDNHSYYFFDLGEHSDIYR